MRLYEFKKKYFADWRIAEVVTYGNERGYIKLRDRDSFIKLYFKFKKQDKTIIIPHDSIDKIEIRGWDEI